MPKINKILKFALAIIGLIFFSPILIILYFCFISECITKLKVSYYNEELNEIYRLSNKITDSNSCFSEKICRYSHGEMTFSEEFLDSLNSENCNIELTSCRKTNYRKAEKIIDVSKVNVPFKSRINELSDKVGIVDLIIEDDIEIYLSIGLMGHPSIVSPNHPAVSGGCSKINDGESFYCNVGHM